MRHVPITIGLILSAFSATPFVVAQQPNRNDQVSEVQLIFWRSVKNELIGPRGPKYWLDGIKDAFIPGGANGLHTLRGTVLASKPTERPTELVLALSDDHNPEVTLRLVDDQRNPAGWKRPVPPGTKVEFSGTAMAFTQEPFMLTFDVDLGPNNNVGLKILDQKPEKSNFGFAISCRTARRRAGRVASTMPLIPSNS
jgi:hypothetical protein